MNPKQIFKTLIFNNGYYLWVILLFGIVTLLFDVRVALFELTVFALLLTIYIVNAILKRNQLLKYVHSLALNVDSASRDSMFHFPLPVVILRMDGAISWYNDLFADMIGLSSERNISDAFEQSIVKYIPEFHIEEFYKEDSRLSCYIAHGGKTYNVFGNVTRTEGGDDYMLVLYWQDRTADEQLKEHYNQEKFVSAVIVVDNYDDVIQDTPGADRPMLLATLEEKLDLWANDVNGILKKLEKDRYFFCFEKRYLNLFIEKKFNILDTIREISIGNKFPFTLSIGVGCDGKNMAQNDAYSYVALDMALGRGGDQVVVKNAEKYRFFGGKSKELEKRTRVKARVVAGALRELIEEAENVIIMGHKHADVDVLGAAMGLYRAVTNAGKEAKILMQTYNQSVRLFMDTLGSEYDELFINSAYAAEIITKRTLLIVVDTHMRSLVESSTLLNDAGRIVIIDHHRRSTDFIDKAVLTYHEPYASSTSELVTEMLQYMDDNTNLKRAEADALYAGIYMDTKNFTFKTGVRTFEAASVLKKLGVDTVYVKKLFQLKLETINKKWKIVENSYIYKQKIAISTCKKNDDDMQTIVAQAADELLNVKDVTCSFVLCQMDKDVIISARSFGDVNVQVVLEKLGGGGHMTIAGATMKNTSIDEAADALKDAIDEHMKNK